MNKADRFPSWWFLRAAQRMRVIKARRLRTYFVPHSRRHPVKELT